MNTLAHAPRQQRADLAEIRACIPMAPLIGRRVKLTRSGRDWIGCCPFHGEKTASFHVYHDHFHCYGCGTHGDALDFVMKIQGTDLPGAIEILSSEAGLSSAKPTPNLAAPRADDTAERERKIARGRTIYTEAGPAGEMVATYLAARGCARIIPGILRFHPACPRPDGGKIERLPAMVAPITDPTTNTLIGAHCTYLRADGAGKIEHGKTKIMWGGWGVIRLSPDDEVTTALGICEGIETGLTIMQRAGWRPIWAAGCSGQIEKFPVLGGIECLTLFPDLDDSGAGQQAAEVCARRWESAGREVQTILPPGGHDWNDALVGKAA